MVLKIKKFVEVIIDTHSMLKPHRNLLLLILSALTLTKDVRDAANGRLWTPMCAVEEKR